jgi:hypothetical protein
MLTRAYSISKKKAKTVQPDIKNICQKKKQRFITLNMYIFGDNFRAYSGDNFRINFGDNFRDFFFSISAMSPISERKTKTVQPDMKTSVKKRNKEL